MKENKTLGRHFRIRLSILRINSKPYCGNTVQILYRPENTKENRTYSYVELNSNTNFDDMQHAKADHFLNKKINK